MLPILDSMSLPATDTPRLVRSGIEAAAGILAQWLDGLDPNRVSANEVVGATAVPRQKLRDLGVAMTAIPERLDVHKTVKRVIENRRVSIETGENIDWGTAEHLAFATLLDEGNPVRLAGQDSVRGTFVQRHCDLIDQTTEEHYTPLQNLRPGQAHFEVLDSALSEEAVLGFEYGFSLTDPKTLTLWEGQFGDFANGAQVVVDQFISSGERKWLRMSGLVMLLPHGYEGQGPEHSSARLERYLQLCAEDNMQVMNITTPANYFHALRRQMVRQFRKPMIIMSPKSLLRHKSAVSKVDAFMGESHFMRILSDPNAPADKDVKRLVLCSGKVFYDLAEARDAAGDKNTSIVRIEQIYPFPSDALVTRLKRMTNLETVVWAQEEPKNNGSWFFVEPLIEQCLAEAKVGPSRPAYAGRAASAATATGLARKHAEQQKALVADALGHKD